MNHEILAILLAVLFGNMIVLMIKGSGQHGGISRLALIQIEGKIDALLDNVGIKYDSAANVPASVLEAARNGRKIEAIRLYRQSTGVGLKEAKDFVEGHTRGWLRIQDKLDALLKNAGVNYDPVAQMQSAAREAVRSGRKIEAIELYRASTGASLKEAKEFVDEMTRRSVP